jgi:Xaa-Pro aminopeptidase
MRVAPPDFHAARHRRLRDRMRADGIDALLVTHPPNLAYITGLFASTGAALVRPDSIQLIVDGRYASVARQRQSELGGIAMVVVPPGGSIEEAVAAEVAALSNARTGFEADYLSVTAHSDLVGRVSPGAPRVSLEPVRGLVERLRSVKDDWELERLRDAGARLSDAAKCIIPKVLAGMTERQVAAVIEAELRRVGFDKPAFDTIVATGPNSALPHYRAGDRVLATGDLVVLDFGGMLDGYAVDLTRTVTVGRPSERQRRLLEQLIEAQAAGYAAVKVGKPATAVDDAARRVLEREGLGDAFSHGTGHGLGLEVHERPRVGRWRAGQADEALEPGMVFTIEPGAYLPGWGGARIEDDVVVTASGGDWLTDVPRLF